MFTYYKEQHRTREYDNQIYKIDDYRGIYLAWNSDTNSWEEFLLGNYHDWDSAMRGHSNMWIYTEITEAEVFIEIL